MLSMGNCFGFTKGWFDNHTFTLSYYYLVIPAQIKTDKAPAYIFKKMKQVFANYIKHITGIPHNSTGKAVIERSNQTIKDILNKEIGIIKIPKNRLHNVLLTLTFLS